MNELYYAAILFCLWALYKFDVVRRDGNALKNICDIKNEITKHHLKERAGLRRQLHDMTATCVKLESEIVELEYEIETLEKERKRFVAMKQDYERCSKSVSKLITERTHLNDRINGLKSLISRMKNERDRLSKGLVINDFWIMTNGSSCIEFEPSSDIDANIAFHSYSQTEKEAIKQFEKLTGLKVRKGGEQ